jgi:hypothetical protein
MVATVISELLSRYLFDDGTVQQITILSTERVVKLIIDVPILPGHPAYSKARMKRNLRQGHIYSPEDWRRLELVFSGTGVMEATFKGNKIEYDKPIAMPYDLMIDEFELKPLSPAAGVFHLVAEDLLVDIEFKSFEYREVAR